jgi:S1-C subfamily serine protease
MIVTVCEGEANNHVAGSAIPEEDVDEIVSLLGLPTMPSCDDVYTKLGPKFIALDRFVYVGPWVNGKTSFPRFMESVAQWGARVIMPFLRQTNERRVAEATPQSPLYDVGRVLSSMFVLESTDAIGSAFALDDGRIVTCAHVLRPDTYAFQASNFAQKFEVDVVASDPDLDLAVIRITSGLAIPGLPIGDSDSLQLQSPLLVAGFANYNVGDSGLTSPGHVIGFRPRHGFRRILVSSTIVAGMSGGPAVDRNHRVVGIAVTGTRKLNNTEETEDRSLIPIEALSYLR